MNPLATVLISALAGALATLLSQTLREWWKRPILTILFDESVEGCRIETNSMESKQPFAWYVRLKIQNRGRSTAKDVSVSVINLKFKAQDGGTISFGEEVLDLKLSSRKNQTVFRLAARAHHYIDLVHAVKIPNGVAYLIDFAWTPERLNLLGFRQGTYSAEVFVAADNAESVNRTISWTWDSRYDGIRIPPAPRERYFLRRFRRPAPGASSSTAT
jgi:hypothetical protein